MSCPVKAVNAGSNPVVRPLAPIAQRSEQPSYERLVLGSNPSGSMRLRGETGSFTPFKRRVAGSNPAGGTMSQADPIEIAKKIAHDIEGRKGLGNEWEEIDPEIQEEIVEEWATIIGRYL